MLLFGHIACTALAYIYACFEVAWLSVSLRLCVLCWSHG